MYANPKHNIFIQGDINPKSKFLGNSAATIMQGQTRIIFLNRPDEVYYLTLPNAYARGILFGTMYMEMGDSITIKCPETDLVAEIEFKIKGLFTGIFNGIGGRIKKLSTNEVLFNLNGKWTDTITIQKVSQTMFGSSNKSEQVLIDVTTAPLVPKTVLPESQQEEFESRRLWSKVTKGLTTNNIDSATVEKTLIEENQRKLCKSRASKDAWTPRFFDLNEESDEYDFKTSISKIQGDDPKKAYDNLEQTIFSPPTNSMHSKFWMNDLAPLSVKNIKNGNLPSPDSPNSDYMNDDDDVVKIDISQGSMLVSPISPAGPRF